MNKRQDQFLMTMSAFYGYIRKVETFKTIQLVSISLIRLVYQLPLIYPLFLRQFHRCLDFTHLEKCYNVLSAISYMNICIHGKKFKHFLKPTKY